MSAALKLDIVEERMLTYQDYLRFPSNGKRWEIIDGVPYMMAAPSENHQLSLGGLFSTFFTHLRGKKCRVFVAPFDVRLSLFNEKRSIDARNVIQPDISIYCDIKNVDERGGYASPDLVVEVISPSSKKQDRQRKFQLYERAGVKEYWIVEPVYEEVEIYRLVEEKFVKIGEYENDGETLLPAPEVGCGELANLRIPVAQIFEANIRDDDFEDNENEVHV